MQRRQFNAFATAATFTGLTGPVLLPRPAHAAAKVGQPAPDFSLSDTAGKTVSLSQFKGRPVVLEWNNQGCPFVRKHYNGNMQSLQKDFTNQGVVWLPINSTETQSSDHLSPDQLARWMRDKGASSTRARHEERGLSRTRSAHFLPRAPRSYLRQ